MLVTTKLPLFTGFYSGVFELDSMEARALEMYNDFDNNEEEALKYNDKRISYNYEAFYNAFSVEAVAAVNVKLNEILNAAAYDSEAVATFVELWQPKQYNFSTDEILVSWNISESFLDLCFDYVNANLEAFEVYVKNNFTSYDGFMSFYTNDLATWLLSLQPDSIEKDNYILFALIDFILKNEKLDSVWLYYEISDTGLDLYDYMQVSEKVTEEDSEEVE